jgi:hypothetical protein
MTVPEHLGKLESLSIWLEHSELVDKNDWFLSKIIVVDRTMRNWYVLSFFV